MTMLTNHNGPEFSEDPTSIYRRDLIASKTADYMVEVTALHNHRHTEGGDRLQARVEWRHAEMVAAALPPSEERDRWMIAAQDAYDRALTAR